MVTSARESGPVVFPNDFDRSQHPARTRFWGMFLGTLLMLLAGAALISPRTLPYGAPILMLGVVSGLAQRGAAVDTLRTPSRVALPIFMFLAFALSSSFWAAHPALVFVPVLGAIAAFGACAIMSASFMKEPRCNILHIAEGLTIGFSAGLLYLLIEITTDQWIKIHVYNWIGVTPGILRPPEFVNWKNGKVQSISPSDLTRNIAPVTLYLWAGLLAVQGTLRKRNGQILSWVLFLLACIVIGLSEHETSKFALVTGILAFLLSRWRPAFASYAIRLGWVLACLAVIPGVLTLYRLNLHNAKWVQPSARHRVIIWNHTAEQALKSPYVGIGAGMMYYLSDPIVPLPGEKYSAKVPHAHNVYLQTWFELGAIGAALLTLVGLAVLERIRRLSDRFIPYAHATFACSSVVASSSYGMWQIWFVVMFAMVAVLFTIGIRCNIRSDAFLLEKGGAV